MSDNEIKDVPSLMLKYLGESKEIIDIKTSFLTAPGENYRGTLLKVDITIRNIENNTTEKLYAAAKLIPTNEMAQKMFNHVQISFKVEIAFYNTMIPAFQQFQRQKGVQKVMDFFPKMYASRLNLNNSDIVDENVILMLENLIESGYKNVSRFESFDLPTIKLILNDLAAFHAVPLAMRLLNPAIFNSKIKPYLTIDMPPPPHLEDGLAKAVEVFYNILSEDETCRSLVPSLREKLKCFKMGPQATSECKEPYITMVHGDMWINNIMVKFENAKPVATKFLDFQDPTYQSPAVDLLFLLWSSVQKNVLEQNFDDLVKLYHNSFIEHLQQVKCDTTPFSLELFLDEMKSVAKNQILHSFFMSAFVIFYKGDDPFKPPHLRAEENVSEIVKERVICMIKICNEKGWI